QILFKEEVDDDDDADDNDDDDDDSYRSYQTSAWDSCPSAVCRQNAVEDEEGVTLKERDTETSGTRKEKV
ncbi:hypothetical protein PV326_013222, partial [Microctonus aethiopoides]